MGMFSGKSGSQSKSSSGGSSKSSSTQKKLNAALKASGGKWTKEVNDLARQRDREKGQTYNASTKTYSSTGGGSGGLKSIGNALKNAPKNIIRDIGMGVGLKDRDADYYRRTANTIARTQGKAAADRYISQMTNKGGLAAAGVKNADVSGSVNYGQRIGMLNRDGSVNKNYMGNNDGGGGSSVITPAPEDVQSPADQTQVNQAMLNRMRMQQEQAARAANMNRARMMFERQNMMSPGPMPRQMQGLGGFRRQLPPGMSERMMRPAVMPPQFPENRMPGYGGQGVMRPAVMPRYPQPMPRNQASSPAFRYAAQNYDRLGGMQRTMPRPMEMMSRAERQQIGRIADRMPRPPEFRTMQNPYVGILQRGIRAKCGGRTMPQRPPMSGKGGGRTMPQTGGGMPRPPLPFAFGRF